MNRSILIRYENDDQGTWRLYWSGSLELADPREFKNIEDAGAAANVLLAQASMGLVR